MSRVDKFQSRQRDMHANQLIEAAAGPSAAQLRKRAKQVSYEKRLSAARKQREEQRKERAEIADLPTFGMF